MLRLDGKIAFITGVGSVGQGWGNGRAIAVLLARQGAIVFGTDIEKAAADATLDIITKEGGSGAVTRCDMTDSFAVRTAVDECLNRYGRIDILVNNVGGSAPGDPVTMEEDVWDRQVDLNLKPCF
jgi:NAD(P)-dependent dehydrogenase (short-subunit alcohol dehydrogenase family)